MLFHLMILLFKIKTQQNSFYCSIETGPFRLGGRFCLQFLGEYNKFSFVSLSLISYETNKVSWYFFVKENLFEVERTVARVLV